MFIRVIYTMLPPHGHWLILPYFFLYNCKLHTHTRTNARTRTHTNTHARTHARTQYVHTPHLLVKQQQTMLRGVVNCATYMPFCDVCCVSPNGWDKTATNISRLQTFSFGASSSYIDTNNHQQVFSSSSANQGVVGVGCY